MGIELPAELADVAAKAGVSWPQADEDKLRASATAWREAGAKLATLAGESDGSAGKALAALTGSTGDAARGHWNKFTAPDGTLNAVLRGCHAAADRLDHAAEQVGAAKVELVRELVNLAKNNDAAQQAANAGHPTALLGLETAVRGAAANVAHLTETLTSAVRLDSGVQVGGHQPPVNANPGVHAPGDAGPGQAPGQGAGSGQPHGGGLLGGLLPGPGQPGLVDALLPGGGSEGAAPGGVPAPAGGHGAAHGGSGAAPGTGQAPGLVGGLLGAVTDTVSTVAEPVVDLVETVAPPVAAVVEPVLDQTGEAVRNVGGAVDDTVGRTVQGAADAVETVAGGHDTAPGRSGGAPGHGPVPGQGGAPAPGNLVGDLVNPVVGATGPVVDAVTRTEGTVHQSSATVLDRPLLSHVEAPHATAQPAAPAANPAAPQGPSFSGPSLGGPPAGGVPAAAPAAAAAAVAQGPAANAAATTQAPGQQAGQQAAPKAEARAAQATQPQPTQPQPGQPQPGQSPSGQGQSGSGQSGQAQNQAQNQGQGAQGKGEAAPKAEGQAKADAQPKGEAQAKGELKDVQKELKDALAAVGQQVKDGDLAFAIVPLPTGGRDTLAPPLPAGPTSALLPTEPDDTPPAPPVRAARTAQPTTEAAALFLLHMFPGGTLPPPSTAPARQLPPPSEDEAFAAGLRFEPQGHPDGDLVDASARFGLDLRAAGDSVRSRLSGGEASAPASGDPVPAVNRPRLVLTPGGAPDPALLEGYDPLAGLHERDWDRRFLVRADPPEYAWPPGELFPEGGYEAGQPGVLAVGVELDRFGGPEGRVLSQLGTAYAERSLPPALVHAGYHRYRVVKVLPVWFTLSAEWFGQPGGGVRYRATYPVADLVALGYLEEMA
ncbi:glycohydrolase toxin TNT-related protein [Saccharothrix sp. S26]|uniref:TNT domain-containing protein n=1 Tax=Saccharothrix sp. S26 TaxID=2907215 RepID=UPI001F1B2C29|nr:TNT domain-containing protein [Saccharothrix sp. S26]MCE6999377.1 glycohydrolase toxin TNT-related protein [Saccharothrix sp. S26]